MNNVFCGLDFGTSNSTVGLVEGEKPRLAPVEDTKLTIPSAIFFSFEDNQTYYGRKGIEEYIEGAEGRLMRALKSVLGSSLAKDSTYIKSRQVAFIDILGMFINHLKTKAEEEAGQEIDRVVLGRPVQFVDDNPEADAEAQGQLEAAARKQGFRHIEFQFEPIAAALDYEQQVTREQLALIVDIGGGTSDFSIVRVSPERAKATDRKGDILANVGVHIGGTDFDRYLSLAKVMPHLGYKTLNKEKALEVPSKYYFELATWQRINWLYTKQTMVELRQVRHAAMHPELIERLIAVVESRQGHNLASKVEDAKIQLTASATTSIDLGLLGGHLNVDITRQELDDALNESVDRIVTTVQKTLDAAALKPADIQAIFLTGGSTQIPIVKDSILSMFANPNVVEGDMFGSVGLGLGLDAKRKFA